MGQRRRYMQRKRVTALSRREEPCLELRRERPYTTPELAQVDVDHEEG